MKIALLSRLPILLLGVATAAALSFAHPVKANLITNPGFETGNFNGWTNAPGLGIVTGTSFGVSPHSGGFQGVFQQGADSLSQSVATTSGAGYTISFFLAQNSTSTQNSFSVSWGGVSLLSLTNQSPFGYTEYTFNVTGSPGSTTPLLFQFNSTPGSLFGIWFLDDVSVNPAGASVPDAGSTLPLVGFVSLGLAALRRKLSC